MPVALLEPGVLQPFLSLSHQLKAFLGDHFWEGGIKISLSQSVILPNECCWNVQTHWDKSLLRNFKSGKKSRTANTICWEIPLLPVVSMLQCSCLQQKGKQPKIHNPAHLLKVNSLFNQTFTAWRIQIDWGLYSGTKYTTDSEWDKSTARKLQIYLILQGDLPPLISIFISSAVSFYLLLPSSAGGLVLEQLSDIHNVCLPHFTEAPFQWCRKLIRPFYSLHN